VTEQLSLLTAEAPVRSVKTEHNALRIGFAGRYHLWVGGPWRVESLETAALESIGVLIGQTLQSGGADAAGLTLVFSRHRIVVRPYDDEAGNARNHLAILYEADYPAVTW